MVILQEGQVNRELILNVKKRTMPGNTTEVSWDYTFFQKLRNRLTPLNPGPSSPAHIDPINVWANELS